MNTLPKNDPVSASQERRERGLFLLVRTGRLFPEEPAENHATAPMGFADAMMLFDDLSRLRQFGPDGPARLRVMAVEEAARWPELAAAARAPIGMVR